MTDDQCEASGAPSGKHVAVIVFPFASHPSTLLNFTRRLLAAAPPTTTTTFSFFGTEKSNSAIHNNMIRSFTIRTGLPEYVEVHDPTVHPEPEDWLMNTAEETLKVLIEDAEATVGSKISCLVSDVFMWMAGDLAEEMGVPWVAVRTGGPRSVVAHLDIDLIRTTVGIGAECKEKILEFIPGFSTTRCEDLPEGIVLGDLDTPSARVLYKVSQTLPEATTMVIHSFEEADPDVTGYLHSKFQKCLHIGPSILASPPPFKDEHDCIPWLDGRDPLSVVYISFGTMFAPLPSELLALAEALKETGYPFLWSLKGNPKEKFPKDFLEVILKMNNGKFVPWAPQLAVLMHGSIGVFVTHCGWNSLMEGIIGGVPVIGRPFVWDQPMNRVTMEQVWGIGVGIEGGSFTKDGTVKALRMIMSQEQGKCMRGRSRELKRMALKSMDSDGSSTLNFNSLLEIINC